MHPALLQPDPPLPESVLQSLTESLAFFVASLCDALAGQCGADRLFAPVGVLLWARLNRTVDRFQLLFTRWREGRLPATRRRAPNPPNPHAQDSGGPEPDAAEPKPNDTLPGAFAWLVKLMPHAACYSALLQEVLTHPDLPAFLAAAPQAGRLLRPICHMLGAHPLPDLLRPPPPNPDAPPRKPRTVTTTPRKLRFWIDKNGATGPRNALPEDLSSVRPVSLWVR